LAGLHEFPSRPNVLESETTPLRKIAHNVLSELLAIAPILSGEEDTLADSVETSRSSVILQSVKPAGDILHIFSHIRKTYRVQWVLLDGGQQPPALLKSDTKSEARQTKGVIKRNKIDKKKQGRDVIELDSDGDVVKNVNIEIDVNIPALSAKWIQIERVPESKCVACGFWTNVQIRLTNVPHYSISTGMAKVWAQVELLWSNKAGQQRRGKRKARDA
jgi:hypothetical protein